MHKEINDRVKRISLQTHHKTIVLESGSSHRVTRYACLTKGDEVVIRGTRRIGLYVACHNGLAQVLPAYNKRDDIEIGGRRLQLKVKEIASPEEMEGYLNLAAFHYRNEHLAGRRTVLVAVSDEGLGPSVLGYIELSTSLFMNKARQTVLDASFSDDMAFADWKRWDVTAARKYTNLIVRIARCVVHPEYRGLGIGKALCRHALDFAKKHWQAGKVKPYFVEITADMLKFVPFVKQAGMVYIGNTEGNLARVAKDMEYLVANLDRVEGNQILRRGGGGIVAVQKKYLRQAVQVLASKGLSASDLGERLGVLASTLTAEEYFSFHGILRLPKPTYLKGLSRRADMFLRRRVRDLGITAPEPPTIVEIKPLVDPIRLCELTAATRSSVDLTTKTMQVQEAFGIRPDHLQSLIFRQLDIEIPPGSIVLVFGASGSGKTTLLRIMAGDIPPAVFVSGRLDMPTDARVGTFEPLPGDRPLVELLGQDDVSKSLYCLNMAGLSEAQLYLRRFDELSNGQRYRAMLARLIDSEANVWIADEFLSTLDPITACVVAKNIREHAKKSGVTLVAGAPHFANFIGALQPDMVVRMQSPWEYQVLSGAEFATRLAS